MADWLLTMARRCRFSHYSTGEAHVRQTYFNKFRLGGTMLILRTGLIATAVALLTGSATVAAAHAQTALAPGTGTAVLNTNVNLPRNSTWTSIPLEVHLPGPGTYEIDADVRGRLQGTPPVNTWITARLWNVTTGAELPGSERLVYQIIDGNSSGAPAAGGNQTAPISELIEVDRPETIQLQAEDSNSVGAADIAQIYSDSYGYTTLRYVWVGS
jgi:hypothetical protein